MRNYFKIITTAVLLMAALTGSRAEEMRLGYCDGLIATADQGYVTSKTGSGIVQMAIRLSADMLQTYAGNSITAVRVGLPAASAYPTELTGWVRSEKDAPTNLAEGSTYTFQEGWNVIELAQPVDVPSQPTDLWVGVQFKQSKRLQIISFAGNSHPDACWIAKGNVWQDLYDAANDFGSLSVEAVVSGSNLPQHDLCLRDCRLVLTQVKQGADLHLRGTVKNCALTTAAGYRIVCSINGRPAVSRDFDAVLPYDTSDSFAMDVPTGDCPAGDAELSVCVEWADNSTDETPADNTVRLQAHVYDNAFPQRLVIEQFTGEGCGYCPHGAHNIRQTIEDLELTERTIWVAYHSFGQDLLWSDDCNQVASFFGVSGAPYMMVNRSTRGSNVVSAPVPEADQVSYWLRAWTDQVSYADVKITETSVADGMLTAKVSIEKTPDFDAVCPQPRLFVYVKENNVEAQNQSDYYNRYDTRFHQNAYRTSMTSLWGEPFEWDGNKAERTFQTTLGEAWNVDNLEVVAFVAAYDAANNRHCEIFNADSAKPQSTNAVSAQLMAPAQATYYSLSGQRLAQPVRGIVIERSSRVSESPAGGMRKVLR